MIINIKVIPNSNRNEIVKENEVYKIYINAPASDNKANKALIEILAKYFSAKKISIRILKGLKERNKIVEIDN